ncbi:MAG: Dam family site-specific DNA-(adenine-N6)-methyltransferase [Actinomycetota bacterium]
MALQLGFMDNSLRQIKPFNMQLLKWIGNKQRFAHEIISYFPNDFRTYYEPFLGSGGILGTLAPTKGIASDSFEPLMQIWKMLKTEPERLKKCYEERWQRLANGNKVHEYEKIKESYNRNPNGADLLFLCRACYGGVVRFRKQDGHMSTPCGIHTPISPSSFSYRVDEWHLRIRDTDFLTADFRETMSLAKEGDLIYCDPPYRFSQSIVYGAQDFSLAGLLDTIALCKERGVKIALSIDGRKKSGKESCEICFPEGLFEREVYICCGRSMLRRFQMEGKTLENEEVHDRLLLTY